MMAIRSRLTKTISMLACARCAAGAVSAWAQEAATVPLNGGKCPTAGTPVADALSTPHWNGWGVDSSQHRFQPSAMAQLAADDVPRLKLKWAFGYPGAAVAFAQPTIVASRLFVGSQRGKVYSLDATSGCTYWEFDADKPVRSAIVIGQRGVPRARSILIPFSYMGAVNHLSMYSRAYLHFTCFRAALSKSSCSMLSNSSLMSNSKTQSYFQHRLRDAYCLQSRFSRSVAVRVRQGYGIQVRLNQLFDHHLPNPIAYGGTPKILSPPLFFGMETARTGGGK
jgi:hypothetical protein